MGHRDSRGRGTLVIDRQFRSVGRIKRASGTNDAATFRRVVAMLDALGAKGRLDLLVAVRDGVIRPLDLWDAYRREALDQLPNAATLASLFKTDGSGAVDRWLAAWERSDDHKRGTNSAFAQLRKLNPNPTVGDLPTLVGQYRAACKAAGHHRSFNLAKAAVQAFLRDTLGDDGEAVYRAVTRVKVLRIVAKESAKPFTSVEAFESVASALADVAQEHADIARTMVTTGMHAKELWGRWSTRTAAGAAGAVHVRGTKREGRTRDVPLVMVPHKPSRHRRTFEDRVRDVTDGARSVYDLRRTYAHWLEEAGVPRARRKLYLGHTHGDITDLYERHEVEGYLAIDAVRLTAYLRRGGWRGELLLP